MWYEWHAEAFLGALPSIVVSGSQGLPPSLLSSPTVGVPSPLIDAIDLQPRHSSVLLRDAATERSVAGLVKIGHTSLHNAGGRSSWIGL